MATNEILIQKNAMLDLSDKFGIEGGKLENLICNLNNYYNTLRNEGEGEAIEAILEKIKKTINIGSEINERLYNAKSVIRKVVKEFEELDDRLSKEISNLTKISSIDPSKFHDTYNNSKKDTNKKFHHTKPKHDENIFEQGLNWIKGHVKKLINSNEGKKILKEAISLLNPTLNVVLHANEIFAGMKYVGKKIWEILSNPIVGAVLTIAGGVAIIAGVVVGTISLPIIIAVAAVVLGGLLIAHGISNGVEGIRAQIKYGKTDYNYDNVNDDLNPMRWAERELLGKVSGEFYGNEKYGQEFGEKFYAGTDFTLTLLALIFNPGGGVANIAKSGQKVTTFSRFAMESFKASDLGTTIDKGRNISLKLGDFFQFGNEFKNTEKRFQSAIRLFENAKRTSKQELVIPFIKGGIRATKETINLFKKEAKVYGINRIEKINNNLNDMNKFYKDQMNLLKNISFTNTFKFIDAGLDHVAPVTAPLATYHDIKGIKGSTIPSEINELFDRGWENIKNTIFGKSNHFINNSYLKLKTSF